jgi:hypothetical protein
MKKILCLLVILLFSSIGLSVGRAEELAKFQGVVTAVNSNGNRPGLSFTAVDAENHVKMFYISTLKHLDLGDWVALTYQRSDKFPLTVTRIKFSQPKRK